jgi:hypothetical protein
MKGAPPAYRGPGRTGIANLPLHHGRTPRWLFERAELGSREKMEALRRLSRAGFFLL